MKVIFSTKARSHLEKMIAIASSNEENETNDMLNILAHALLVDYGKKANPDYDSLSETEQNNAIGIVRAVLLNFGTETIDDKIAMLREFATDKQCASYSDTINDYAESMCEVDKMRGGKHTFEECRGIVCDFLTKLSKSAFDNRCI